MKKIYEKICSVHGTIDGYISRVEGEIRSLEEQIEEALAEEAEEEAEDDD